MHLTKTLAYGAALAAVIAIAPAQAWEPTHPIEIIVPAGTGGGADQMARTVQGIIGKHNLAKQPVVVVNKSRDEQIAALKEQLAASKAELAKVSAELDRIKKRLANPSN